MKIKDSKIAKEAKAAAEHQLGFYREMMAKEDGFDTRGEGMEPLIDAFNEGYKMSEKESKKKLFVVDTISTFRQRYVVEAECLEHAYDEVTMVNSGDPADAFGEFSQLWLGETIVDGREIKMKHFNKMLVEDKECSSWMGENLIRRIDYSR